VVEHEPSCPHGQWGLKLCASKPTQSKGGPPSAVRLTWGLLYVPGETDDGDDREIEIG